MTQHRRDHRVIARPRNNADAGAHSQRGGDRRVKIDNAGAGHAKVPVVIPARTAADTRRKFRSPGQVWTRLRQPDPLRNVEGRIDAGKIILVGHSFGATAVGAALGDGAPVVGGVLLDPAGIGRQLPQSLKQITVPVMVIGADEDIRPLSLDQAQGGDRGINRRHAGAVLLESRRDDLAYVGDTLDHQHLHSSQARSTGP